jgi:hypothetical protein
MAEEYNKIQTFQNGSKEPTVLIIPFLGLSLIISIKGANHFDMPIFTEGLEEVHKNTPSVAFCPLAGRVLHTKLSRAPRRVGGVLFPNNCLEFTKWNCNSSAVDGNSVCC